MDTIPFRFAESGKWIRYERHVIIRRNEKKIIIFDSNLVILFAKAVFGLPLRTKN
jgi:hypothetical protein